ncbi:fibril protein [Myxococcus sp. Y35]|uniref:fibril protein n=1 Tax=Pseudomyxococcus flavus TaxID=3115648 RepID=UPI003CF11A8E
MSRLRAACAGMLFLAACASSNKSVAPEPRATAAAAPRVEVVEYGFHPQDPIRVGWGDRGLMAFLELLRGPHGERIAWRRVGPCCGTGAPTELEVFEVTYDGLAAPVNLYLDPNTAGAVHAPHGFSLQGLASRPQPEPEEAPRVIEL